jgi:hypothetical protein
MALEVTAIVCAGSTVLNLHPERFLFWSEPHALLAKLEIRRHPVTELKEQLQLFGFPPNVVLEVEIDDPSNSSHFLAAKRETDLGRCGKGAKDHGVDLDWESQECLAWRSRTEDL